MAFKNQEEFDQVLNLASQKLNQGIKFDELSDLEKEAVSLYQDFVKNQKNNELPLSEESQKNLERFEKKRNEAKFEINHITDLHSTPKEFEGILAHELSKKGHAQIDRDKNGNLLIKDLKDNVAIALTGDIGTDFFDQPRHGLDAYLANTILQKANFSKKEEEEFLKNYQYMMSLAGLSEDMVRNRSSMINSQQENPLNTFISYIYGVADPNFLSNQEKKEFRESQNKVQNLLKKAMINHSSKEYLEIKNILKKHNLDSSKVVMVGGNHDVHSALENILGEYLVKPGEIREVSGVKFGNVVRSANGNFMMGNDFDEVFGYAGVREKLESEKIKSKPFQSLLSSLNESGNLNISEKDLKKYIDVSVQRSARGLGSGALAEFMKKEIEPYLHTKLEHELKNIKLPKGADVILNHSVIDDPSRAGLEEFRAHEMLSAKDSGYQGVLVLGGHEHSPTPHKKDGIYHINPGSVAAGNSGLHLLDKNKKYHSSLFESLGENRETIYRHMLKDEIPGQPSGRNKRE